MKRLFPLVLFALAIVATPLAVAKKDKGGPAGPDPMITVSTDCYALSGPNGDTWVNKYFYEGPPYDKNSLIADAIGVADFQVFGAPSVPKNPCVVTWMTPGGTEHVVYVAELPE